MKEFLNAAPVGKTGITSRDEPPFTILSDSQSHDLLRLNAVAAYIWRLCDGRNNVDTIVRKLTEAYNVSPDACANDVITALKTFKQKDVIFY